MARTKKTARKDTEGKAPRKVGSKKSVAEKEEKGKEKEAPKKRGRPRKSVSEKALTKSKKTTKPSTGKPRGRPKTKKVVEEVIDLESFHVVNPKTKEFETLTEVSEIYRIPTSADKYRYRLIAVLSDGNTVNRPVTKGYAEAISSEFGAKIEEKLAKTKEEYKNKNRQPCKVIAKKAYDRCVEKRK